MSVVQRGTVTAAVIIVLLALAACGSKPDLDARVRSAVELLDRAKFGEAMIELKQLYAEHPSDARVLTALARAAVDTGDPRAASSLKAAAAGGGDAAALARLQSRLHLQNGEYQEMLGAIDSGALPLKGTEAALARARSLAGLRRCAEAMDVARPLRDDAAVRAGASVVSAECIASAGNARAAQTLLKAESQAHPESAELWIALGRLQQIAGDGAGAIESWRKAAQHAPGQLGLAQQLNLLASLAELELARRDLEGARHTREGMLALAPGSPVTVLTGALLALQEGKHSDAISALQGLATRQPDNDFVRVALVSALLMSGDREQARQKLTELRARRPRAENLEQAVRLVNEALAAPLQSAEYWLAVASAHNALGQPALACIALERVDQADLPHAQLVLARQELRAQNPAKALPLIEAAIARQPDNPELLALLGQAHRELGDFAAASAAFEKAAHLRSSSALAMANFEVRRAGRLADPAAPLRERIERAPGDAVVRSAYGDELRRAGDLNGAIVQYEQVVAAHPKNAAALNNLAWTYYLAKDARALATARSAWQLAPQAVPVADTYGWLLLQSGDVSEASKILDIAWRNGGYAYPDIRFHYASLLARRGDIGQAQRLLGQLLADTPEFSERGAAEALSTNLTM